MTRLDFTIGNHAGKQEPPPWATTPGLSITLK